MLVSCAAIMSPPGGEKDETPPELVNTIPENKATNYNGNTVELIFSEYIEENTVKGAINILPTLKYEPDIIYKGKRIVISFNDSLQENQTYIIVINRNLSDERKVKLSQGIQFAFSTGDKIDDGSIAGKIFNSKKGSVQLWKIQDELDSIQFFNRIPDYSIDASNNGDYEFNFLSPGNYRLVALDYTLSGMPIDPKKMLYGLHWEHSIKLKNQKNAKNINVYIPSEKNKNQMTQAEWIEGSWGCITFSKAIENYYDKIPIDIFYEDSIKAGVEFFQDPMDNKKINFKLDRSTQDHILIKINDIDLNQYHLFEFGKIKIKMDTYVDTTNISLISPENNKKLQIKEHEIEPLFLIFSSLIDIEKSITNFLLMQDSMKVEFTAEWETPLSVKLFPKTNWSPNQTYNINIYRNSIVPIYGRFLKDSVLTLSFETSDYQKYGSLIINSEKYYSENLKIEVEKIGNEESLLKKDLNLNNQFKLNYLLEGQYLLMFFKDFNGDNKISSGALSPYQPSEWFYYYPDTINIRANWDLELNDIKFGENY